MTTVWIALDVPGLKEAEAVIEHLHPHQHFKVGLELFTAVGPGPVKRWTAAGLHIFLDLKFHDIPRTVERATARVQGLGVDLLTVHAAGGPAMLEGALRAADGAFSVAAVTVLTSLDQTTSERLALPAPGRFSARLFEVARQVGVTAFVTSAEEVQHLRAKDGAARLIVPGIRLPGDAPGDQARVGDPKSAVERGATDLVLGRSVVAADDPAARLREIHGAIEGGVRR